MSELHRRREDLFEEPRRAETARTATGEIPTQFRLRSMLALVALLCLVLASIRQWGFVGGYTTITASIVGGLLLFVRPKTSAVIIAVASALVFVLGFLTILEVHRNSSRTPSRTNVCRSQLQQIALAITNFEGETGYFPPAYTIDDSGRRLHSWRTLILPYLEEGELYEQIDKDIPWNAPANWAATEKTLNYFQCPSHSRHGRGNFTSYVAVTGPDTMWPGATARQWTEVPDGLSRTLLIVEIARTDIAWAEPRDLTLDEVLAAFDAGDVTGIASFHSGEVSLVCFGDVHCRAMPMDDINRETLRAMFTVAGGEPFNLDDLSQPPVMSAAQEEAAP